MDQRQCASPPPSSLASGEFCSSGLEHGGPVLLQAHCPRGAARGQGTCGAVVASYAEFVQASAALDRELVIVGEGGVLAVTHVHAQLIAALGRDPVYVVQPCGEAQRTQSAWPQWLWKWEAKCDCGLKTDVLGKRRGTGIAFAFSPSQVVIKQTLPD